MSRLLLTPASPHQPLWSTWQPVIGGDHLGREGVNHGRRPKQERLDYYWETHILASEGIMCILTVAGDLIMTFHHELSSYSSPSQSLDMAMALEKVCVYVELNVLCTLHLLQCCEVQWNILTDFEKQTR